MYAKFPLEYLEKILCCQNSFYDVSRWKFAWENILSIRKNESGTACRPQIANDPV